MYEFETPDARGRIAALPRPCRCCGKPVHMFDGLPIHTTCIPKHWGKHDRGINASRCAEFKNREPSDMGYRSDRARRMLADQD